MAVWAVTVSADGACRGGGVSGWDFKRKLTSCGANILAATLLQPRVRAAVPAASLHASFACILLQALLVAAAAPQSNISACCPCTYLVALLAVACCIGSCGTSCHRQDLGRPEQGLILRLGACIVQVSDLTGSFRLYRKAVLVDLVKDCTSKG